MTYTIKPQQNMMCMQAEEPAQPQKHHGRGRACAVGLEELAC